MSLNLVIGIVIIFILTACSSSNKNDIQIGSDTKYINKFEINSIYEAFDICLDSDNNVYVADKERIIAININKSKEIKEVVKGLSFCINVDYADGKLYAYDCKENKLMQFIEESLCNEYDLNISNISKIRVLGNYILCLCINKEGKNNILVYDMDKTSGQLITDIENIHNYSTYKGNQIIISTGDEITGINFLIYDIDKLEIIKKDILRLNQPVRDFCYNSLNNTLYYVTSIEISSVSLTSMEQNIIFVNSKLYSEEGNILFNKVITSNNYCVALNSEKEELYIVNLDTEKNRTNLNVFCKSNNYANIKHALEITQNSFPDIKVSFTVIDKETYPTKLLIKLMSQDSDFDIFEMEGRQMYKLIKNEAVQYLDEYPQITNSFSEMFEGIKDGCSHRGKLYGIPTHVSIKALTLDKNLMEDLNLTIPDTPWTWNEFYDYAKNALEKQRTHELPDISIINGGDLYSLMMESYDIQMDLITGSVNYNNTLFKDILQLYKRIIQEKMTHESNNPLFKAVYVDLYMGSDLLVYPPAIEVERKYCLDTVLYCINKYSVKKTAAADFLGIYLSKDVQIRPYSVLCLYKNLDLYKDELDNYIKYYGNPRVSLSNDENYTIYENLINKSVQNQLFLDSTSFISMDSNYTFFTERYNIVKSYLEDTISLGDAVNLIDQKAKYIFNE